MTDERYIYGTIYPPDVMTAIRYAIDTWKEFKFNDKEDDNPPKNLEEELQEFYKDQQTDNPLFPPMYPPPLKPISLKGEIISQGTFFLAGMGLGYCYLSVMRIITNNGPVLREKINSLFNKTD